MKDKLIMEYACLLVLLIKSELTESVNVLQEIKLLMANVLIVLSLHNMLMEYVYAIMEIHLSMDNVRNYLALILTISMIHKQKAVNAKAHLFG